jgi:hypothetical protein
LGSNDTEQIDNINNNENFSQSKNNFGVNTNMSNLNISNINNNNKSNDSILLNKNLKTSMKQTKKNNENSTNNENNIESNINKTFCNTNSQIKQAFDFSQIKIDSENSLNFNNNFNYNTNINSNKESIQQSISSNGNNDNIEIFKVNKEDFGCKIVEDNEQKNAKIMLKSKFNI